MRRRASQGFTLIELVIALAISAVLLAVAIPSFRTTMMNSRRAAATNEIVVTMQLARGESLKRGQRVTLCPTTSPNSGTGTCSDTAADWGTGWLVYVVNGALAAGAAPSCATGRPDTSAGCGDVLLSTRSNDSQGVTISGTTSFTFQPFNRASTSGSLNVCDSRGTAYGRTVTVDALGRPTIQATASSCP